MGQATEQGRSNQRLRTRKDLLQAAARLMKAGQVPSMDEVAEAALVSRATAYRYFPSIESLLLEAPLDEDAPDPQALFADVTDLTPEERVDRAEAALHAMVLRNEAQLRLMLAYSLMQSAASEALPKTPLRQNRRAVLIDAALEPVRDAFSRAEYRRLCAALATCFGPEAMVVFRDVLQMTSREARSVKSWALRTLVRAALDEAAKKH